MKKKPLITIINLLLSFGLVSLISCSDLKSKSSIKGDKVSDRNSAKIENADTIAKYRLQTNAKKELELIEVQLKKDTLEVVSGSHFFYYPFGKYRSVPDFVEHSKTLKKYRLEKIIVDSSGNAGTTLYKYTYKKNQLSIFESNESKFVEIINARIYYEDINLINGIKVGMDKGDLLRKFFTKVNNQSIQNIKVIKFVSGLTGVWNYYYFENDKLTWYNFNTDYKFNDI